MIKVNNVPEYAKDYAYMVARDCDGELWFWGSFNDCGKAHQVASEVDGQAFHTDEIEM